jgi:hypothetical protein
MGRHHRLDRRDIRDADLVRSILFARGRTERNAFAIEAMHALGRSPAPMGELLFRITGAEGSHTIGILGRVIP